MVIRLDIDQIKKIRDDAFECAAMLVEEKSKICPYQFQLKELPDKIRAMKDSPVNVSAKGK